MLFKNIFLVLKKHFPLSIKELFWKANILLALGGLLLGGTSLILYISIVLDLLAMDYAGTGKLLWLGVLLSIFFLGALVLIWAMYVFVDRIIVRRLDTIKNITVNWMQQIDQHRTLSWSDRGGDELDQMARSISDLLQAMDEAREKAQQADQAKSDFLASMSHEIRTPMNAVIGLADVLTHTNLNREQKEHLQSIQASAYHLLHIINDILDLSKIEAKKVKLEDKHMDLHQVLNSVMDILRIQGREKGLALHLEIKENTPRYITGDEVRLKQVLLNLLGNAVKFTHVGWVGLRAELLDYDPAREKCYQLQFLVQDTGTGIEARQSEEIFESFTQAGAATGKQGVGTGLGLAICKELVNLMGGQISVHSVPGKGSSFTFYIQAAEGDPKKIEEPATEKGGEAVQSRPMSILLAEDNPVNARVATAMLQKLGHKATVSSTGLTALEELKQNTFDLVLMDMEMPEMDGLECTRRIRAGEAGKEVQNIPIVAMTAHALLEWQDKAFQTGMDAFLSKPVDLKSLKEMLDRFTEKDMQMT